MTELGERIRGELAAAGTDVEAGAAERLARYVELLLRANREVNLVSRREATPEALVERHLRDALEVLPLLPAQGANPLGLLDVGSGGGLPAVPLLLVRGDLRGTLVESVGKKARFLEAAVTDLGLTARVVNARFPGPALDLMKTASPCDLLTSRAVADAGEIVRQARPALARGAVAFLWTTEPLVAGIRAHLPGARVTFRASPGSERRGIARVECFT